MHKTGFGDLWNENELVFAWQYCGYMSLGYINNELHKILRRHNLLDVHISDLRHAYASLI